MINYKDEQNDLFFVADSRSTDFDGLYKPFTSRVQRHH